MIKYFPAKIEPKWAKKWKDTGLFSPDLDKAKKPFYSLMMFPYPSAEGMHVGNMYAFTGSDVYSRFKRLQGFDVFEPIGLDGFGIHGENYAMKINEHPMEVSKRTEKHFYEQFLMVGNAFDWQRTVDTYKSNYYKWTQWAFLQLYKQGLAYRKKAEVNWCPSCLTVLADEQVISGECERCSSQVGKKELEQWFFKITDYADRLLSNIESLDWSEIVKTAQRNWIGRKDGINIEYELEGLDEKIVCFTTRPDTNFGATFIVIGPEHPLIYKIAQKQYLDAVKKYVSTALAKSDMERIAEGRKKTGVFTGVFAVNRLNGQKLPVWVSDFVLGKVGTGAVVGVPGHDIRDFEFAKEFDLPIVRVVVGKDDDKTPITKAEQVQEEEGLMVNSEFLNGLDIHEATVKIMDYLEEKGWGKRVTSYHLRDWLISRQRYWGPPIPTIYCDKCGIVPVPEEDLPVELPYIKDFKPTGTGVGPLASDSDFVNTTCPKCHGKARRETDVSDNFFDSSLYFFRYLTTDMDDKLFDDTRSKKWLPVDMYIGGAEHSVLHLLYSRFITMAFKDMGFIDFEEPFTKFRAHGLIIKDGAKMSKSKGNVIIPDKYIKDWGADVFRTYLMFMGPFTGGGDFQDDGLNGVYRFLTRIWSLAQNYEEAEATQEEKRILNKTIQKASKDFEKLHYNTVVSGLMELLNFLSRQKTASKETIKSMLIMLSPLAPFITEELWEILERTNIRTNEHWSIHNQPWPQIEEEHLKDEKVTIVIQVDGKLRDNLIIDRELADNQSEIESMAKNSPRVQKCIDSVAIVKVFYVPGKIINFVTDRK
ncbi:MAG: leucine--tRNA ligase [Microgenomates group bacterium]|jgi:leucyl-tRNA synthetase